MSVSERRARSQGARTAVVAVLGLAMTALVVAGFVWPEAVLDGIFAVVAVVVPVVSALFVAWLAVRLARAGLTRARARGRRRAG